MPVSAGFLDFLKEQMAGFGPVAVRRMFGGAGLLRDGRTFALVVDDCLYFKSDAQSDPLFSAESLEPFSYGTKSGRRVVMAYRRAPERCLDDAVEMVRWCRIGWSVALRTLKKSPS